MPPIDQPHFRIKCILAFLILQVYLISNHASGQPYQSLGIDHIPIVVRNLEESADQFIDLGFTIKEGRVHQNSIRNAHVKFEDGSSLELITATEPRDELAQFYVEFLKNGEGAAFLALKVDSMKAMEKLVQTYDLTKIEGSYYIWFTFPDEHPLHYLFFIHYKKSVIDETIHLTHSNSTSGITSITLARPDFSEEMRLFEVAGFSIERSDNNASLQQIKIKNALLMLEEQPAGYNKRPIASVSLRVADLDKVLEHIPDKSHAVRSSHTSITLPAADCHGLEITFTQN